MKIKQTTFYAFRILHRLDTEMKKEKGRLLTSREIAEKEGLSKGVALRILQRMGQEGIVCGRRGRGDASNCGFSLTKSIHEITVLDILKIFDGVDICANLDAKSCQKETQMFSACSRMNEELEELFKKYTIRDLFESGEAGNLLGTG